MSNAKELFQKDEDLRKQLIAVTNADWFQKCLAFAKAEMMEDPRLNEQMLSGARLYESTLLGLPEIEGTNQEPLSSGLIHEPPKLESRKPKEKTT